MPARRFTKRATNFRSFRRRGSSSGPRLHLPTRPKIWQRANFFLGTALIFNDEQGVDPINFVFELALIHDRVGDSTTGIGRAQSEMWKYCDVGGIVMDYWVHAPVINQENGELIEDDSEYFSQLLLCVDRLGADAAPVAIDCNWFNNTMPITTALAQEAQDQDEVFPTRVLWRTAQWHGASWVPHALAGGLPTTNVGSLDTQQVSMGHGRINKRLKLRLDDEHELNLHFTAKANTTTAAGVTRDVRFRAVGSLYYRFSSR